MNPSAHSFVYTATDTCSSYTSTSAGACYGATYPCHPYADYGSGLCEDPSSWTEGWSRESIALGPCPEADRALFETFLTDEVASISPSVSCTAVPMDSPPCYYTTSEFLPHLPEAPQLHAESLEDFPSYPYTTAWSQSTVPPVFEEVLPETTAVCISPELVYPSAYVPYNLADDYSTAASSRSPSVNHRAAHRSQSSSTYTTPSPEPSPRTSATVIASQRRNAPARNTTPVPALNAWQCPHCPYVQRNRRSPDLKRHIKTHTRDDDVADWVCCGVPVLSAIELGVPDRILREAQVFEFDGVLMVGGCRKAFSRRDALHRHLQRERGKCFGDALSLYQRGNRESC
ncbi:hypothetical protein GSI_14358 [Ganoderma sinense ZZ0214-1]|uniref:Uncharacterized protein n=1 Tax=Ganoderma sinense ZZ0214-1 TaxID=1077348 RepID=A0A2G8RNH5_9APHY|nr:hypothetical protein GSI_14358 [Ganoderma sinense ZZ0214-1]